MQQEFFSAAALAFLASTISACNSTDNLSRQGPWGPAQARRSYPEYSAPWGLRPGDPVQYAVSEAAFVPADAVEVELIRTERKREVRFEPDMDSSLAASHVGAAAPPDPAFSASPVPAVSDHPISAPSDTSPALKPSPPGVFTPPRRASSYAGTWNARIGSSACKVQLSTVPSLDLYKASTQGCSHDAMRNVNGWSFRENQIILFSRGQLTARLSGAEASLSGTLSGSSEALEMSR